MNKLTIVAAVTCFSLVGCDSSSPNDVSKKNFQQVIEKYISKDCNYIMPNNVYAAGYPYTVPAKRTETIESLNQFAKVGILNVKETETGEFEYSLTDEGRKINKNSMFCAGYKTVKEIVDFTKPSEFLGVTLSKVEYTYTVRDIPQWAKEIPDLYAELNTTREGSREIYLKNSGWTTEKP